MPEDLELFALLCRDIADQPTISSLEAEQARLLREDFDEFLQSADTYLTRTMLRGRPARSAQEAHLRRCMVDFLMAVLK